MGARVGGLIGGSPRCSGWTPGTVTDTPAASCSHLEQTGFSVHRRGFLQQGPGSGAFGEELGGPDVPGGRGTIVPGPMHEAAVSACLPRGHGCAWERKCERGTQAAKGAERSSSSSSETPMACVTHCVCSSAGSGQTLVGRRGRGCRQRALRDHCWPVW